MNGRKYQQSLYNMSIKYWIGNMWREHFIKQGLRIEQLIVYYSYDTVLVARMRAACDLAPLLCRFRL